LQSATHENVKKVAESERGKLLAEHAEKDQYIETGSKELNKLKESAAQSESALLSTELEDKRAKAGQSGGGTKSPGSICLRLPRQKIAVMKCATSLPRNVWFAL
jgi:hypothetical protein